MATVKCCKHIQSYHTKIKKGIAKLHGAQDGEPLKCPKCTIVHMVTDQDKKIYEEVIGV